MTEPHVASAQQAAGHPSPGASGSFYKDILFRCLLLGTEERVCILVSAPPPKKKVNMRPVLDLQAKYKDRSTRVLTRFIKLGDWFENDKLERHFHVFVVCRHKKFLHFPLRVQRATLQKLPFFKVCGHYEKIRLGARECVSSST